VEELKSCRVREIGVVGMSTQELVGICRILEGEIRSEIPEATYRVVILAISKQIYLVNIKYHSECDG